jgi:hypothetical protein
MFVEMNLIFPIAMYIMARLMVMAGNPPSVEALDLNVRVPFGSVASLVRICTAGGHSHR